MSPRDLGCTSRWPWIPLAAALAIAAPRPAAALWRDRVELFAAQSIGSDSDIFRLGDADAESILGDPDLSDRYKTTSIGFGLDIPLDTQRIVGDATLIRQRYDRFDSLDHDGHAGELAWLWRGASRFEGRVGYGGESRRGSFSNLQGGIQSNRPNFIETQERFADATFRVTTRFELVGSVSERRQKNSAPEFQVSNAHIDRSGLTFYYVAGSGNRAGLSHEISSGRLPVPRIVGGAIIDNSYEQRATNVLVGWTLSEQSDLNLRFGRISRSYAQSATRNYSDWTFSAGYEWRPSEDFSLIALAENGISDFEEVNIGFVVAERVALLPTLRITEKLSLAGQLEQSDREYLGDPGLLTVDNTIITERLRVSGLTVAWTPTPNLRLGFALRTQQRRSNLSFVDYDADIASFEVRVSL